MLNLIIKNNPISRSEIAEKTRMSFTSASRIVISLLKAGLIVETKYEYDGAGRKASYLIPKKDAAISVGVEIDKKQIRIGFMNFAGELMFIEHLNYRVKGPEQTVQFIVEQIHRIINEKSLLKTKITGICIGLPGLVNLWNGYVRLSAQFNWKDVPLKEMIEDELLLPVFVENELKLKAIAEYEMLNKDTIKDIVLLGFGSGVGSVLMSEGAVYRGNENFAGEIGHTIVDPNGNYCPCGNFGCLQTYIAEPFLLEEAAKVKPVENVSALLRESENGERWATRIIDKAITYAAITINNVINIHSPDLVIISGFLVEDYQNLREAIFDAYDNQIDGLLANKSAVKTSRTKSDGIVIGSALNVQQNYIQNTLFS